MFKPWLSFIFGAYLVGWGIYSFLLYRNIEKNVINSLSVRVASLVMIGLGAFFVYDQISWDQGWESILSAGELGRLGLALSGGGVILMLLSNKIANLLGPLSNW